MFFRFSRIAVLLLSVLFLSGCGLMQTTKNLFSGQPGYLDGTEAEQDSWTSGAGNEGRGNRAREQDPDPILGKFMYSKKYRDIEKNLGYDY